MEEKNTWESNTALPQRNRCKECGRFVKGGMYNILMHESTVHNMHYYPSKYITRDRLVEHIRHIFWNE